VSGFQPIEFAPPDAADMKSERRRLTFVLARSISIPYPAPAGFLALEMAMTGMTRSSDGLDVRRRRILFRSWHRGMREADLIMGRFADAAIAELSEDEVAAFERLLEQPDRDVLAWVTGEEDVPADHDTALYRKLRDFHLGNARVGAHPDGRSGHGGR
jgi:antitoxin CptB